MTEFVCGYEKKIAGVCVGVCLWVCVCVRERERERERGRSVYVVQPIIMGVVTSGVVWSGERVKHKQKRERENERDTCLLGSLRVSLNVCFQKGKKNH